MLRKVELRIMKPISDHVQLARELEGFEARAKEAAYSLFTLCHQSVRQGDMGMYTALAKNLLSFAALLSMLQRYLSPECSSGPKAMIVVKCIGACNTFVEGVESAEQIVERWNPLGFEDERDFGKEAVFMQFEKNPQLVNDVLDSCMEHILGSLTAAQPEPLSAREHL
jgi:hypothetical protein